MRATPHPIRSAGTRMIDVGTTFAFDGEPRSAAVAQGGSTPAIHAMPLAVAMMAVGGVMSVGGGDVELGRHLASECLTCHRAGGATVPALFGMAPPRFTTAIKAYRDRERPNPVMQTIAGRLTDEEITALAAYFAQTNPR
jgi:cytochrome c